MISLQRSHLVGIGIVVLLFGLTVGLPWLSPTKGVERAWRELLDGVEDNDFEAVAALVSEDYRDRWGLTQPDALAILQALRRQFLVCTVEHDPHELAITTDKQRATIRSVIRVSGSGSPIAQMITQASQQGAVQTTFVWVRRSWKPWDWALVEVENPQATPGVRRLQREAKLF